MSHLTLFQIIIAFTILNVWLLRRNKATLFRGGSAQSMAEEFSHYGLPDWALPAVGTAKVFLAVTILAGLWFPSLTGIGAAGLGAFMLVAVLMHLKVRDSFVKTAPSLALLILCVYVFVSATPSGVPIALN